MPQLPAARVIEPSQRWLGSSVQRETLNAHYITGFSYSGPTTAVHVEQDARDGKNAYIDHDTVFAGLPEGLLGADWVQAANGDSVYHAVDLMEIGVKGGTIVSIAHDDRWPRPAWLTRQFQPTDMTLIINGQPMKLFQRRVERDESLTLGANAENTGATSCNMYVVFVNASTTGQSRSEWVYPGPDGKLVSKTTPAGDRIMDFSHAGYMGGGVVLPQVPVRIMMRPVEGDNTGASMADPGKENIFSVWMSMSSLSTTTSQPARQLRAVTLRRRPSPG